MSVAGCAGKITRRKCQTAQKVKVENTILYNMPKYKIGIIERNESILGKEALIKGRVVYCMVWLLGCQLGIRWVRSPYAAPKNVPG